MTRCRSLLVFLAGSTVCLAGASWPQLLGPQRDGHSAETGLKLSWDKDGPRLLWEKEAGIGFSAPVCADGKLLLYHRIENEHVLECFEASTGKSLWKQGTATEYQDPYGKGDGPRSTPLVADGAVYTLSPEGILQRRKLADGKKDWQRDLLHDYEVPPSFFGVGTTPLVAGKLLLVNVGGKDAGVVAFDCRTGKEVWKATDEGASYSSPVLAKVGGKPAAVFFTRQGILLLDPARGTVRYQQRWRSRMDASVNAAAPVVWDDHLFFTACYGTGAILVHAEGNDFATQWKSDRVLSCHFSTPVYHADHLYGLDGRQETGTDLRCVEARTGKVLWTRAGFGCGSMILVEGGLIVLSEAGELVRVACNPERYEETSRAWVLKGSPCLTPIGLSDGLLFARDSKTLKCWSLKK